MCDFGYQEPLLTVKIMVFSRQTIFIQRPLCRYDAIMDVCLNSTFHATKAALPDMIERGWGRVINTGSMHALVASPYKSAYNAAKHGVVSHPYLLSYVIASFNILLKRSSL